MHAERILLRQGEDEGGMACGPCGGSDVTEGLYRKEGELFFVSMSRMDRFANIYVSRTSLFDILVHLMDRKTDMEYEMDVLERYSLEQYDLTLPDTDQIKFSVYVEQITDILETDGWEDEPE